MADSAAGARPMPGRDPSVLTDAAWARIRRHAEGHTSDDPTIGVCWDADRLDLGRVGMRPRARYMSTAAGRKLAGDR
jgi:uncharacterized protein